MIEAINMDVTFATDTVKYESPAYVSDIELKISQVTSKSAFIKIGYDAKDNEFSGDSDQTDTDGG